MNFDFCVFKVLQCTHIPLEVLLSLVLHYLEINEYLDEIYKIEFKHFKCFESN